jgi:hypothetical protein
MKKYLVSGHQMNYRKEDSVLLVSKISHSNTQRSLVPRDDKARELSVSSFPFSGR